LFWRTPGGPYNGVEIYRGIFITVFQRQDGAFPFLFSVWKPKNNAVLFAVSHKPTAPNTCEMSVPSWYTTTWNSEMPVVFPLFCRANSLDLHWRPQSETSKMHHFHTWQFNRKRVLLPGNIMTVATLHLHEGFLLEKFVFLFVPYVEIEVVQPITKFQVRQCRLPCRTQRNKKKEVDFIFISCPFMPGRRDTGLR